MKTLMISTDRQIFTPGSPVQARMAGYADQLDELFIVVLGLNRALTAAGKLKYLGLSRWRALWWKPLSQVDSVTAQDPFETGFIAWRLARFLKTPLELQLHTDFLSPYFARQSLINQIRVWLAKFLLPRASKIRVVSQRLKAGLEAEFNRLQAPIEVRPIAVDPTKFQAPATINLHQKYPQFGKIILMASRLAAEKNIGLAIKAMAEVVKSLPRAGLIIVGAGPEELKLKKLVKSQQLEANVIFEPWTEDLASYYKTADLFLLTSFYEGYGLTLVEAAAAGCPIISTDVGVAREVGAVLTGYDPAALAALLKKILQ